MADPRKLDEKGIDYAVFNGSKINFWGSFRVARQILVRAKSTSREMLFFA